MIATHTQLLNYLVKKHGLKSYLEIGVQNPANNFDKIECLTKCSVDPDPNAKAMFDCTSDEFFNVNTTMFDLIFIDGLHHADQVIRDFENSLQCLNENGFIVCHDTLPETEATTHVPRDSRVWHGDVYKWAMHIHEYSLEYRTILPGPRSTVISKKPIAWNENEFEHLPTPIEETFDFYLKNRNKLLRIIHPSEIETYL